MKTGTKRFAGAILAIAMGAFSLPLSAFAQNNTAVESYTVQVEDLLTLNYYSGEGEGTAQRVGEYTPTDAKGGAYLISLPFGAIFGAEDITVKEGYELDCYSLVATDSSFAPDKAESLEQGLKTPLTDNDFTSYKGEYWKARKDILFYEGCSMPVKQVEGVLLTLSSNDERDVIILQTSTRDPYSPYWQGKGYKDSPYLIKDGEDLKKLSDSNNIDGEDYSGLYFRLESDVTLPDGWEPIGTTKNRFGGYIDGNGKTLTVPAGSLSLIGTPSGAKLWDLSIYGEKIPGYGVIQGYTTGCTMDINNVTIKSGSHILYSGFVGGYGNESVNIYNSTVEPDVVIGDDGSWGDLGDTETVYPFVGTFTHRDNIGSFGGAFNGTISGCVSYADVYGHDNVGGIVGFKGQSMRDFYINNCAFYGRVISDGEMVGGIAGNGYTAGSAPATPCVTIENSYASGSVSGENNVGGIFGGEKGAKTCWNNGIGRIRNNYFSGTLSASAENAAVGGVIGYMNTMNRYNIVYNNYYINNCGANNGIGKLGSYVSVEDDARYGIAYNPISEGAAKIATAFSPAELTDGTLTAKLNSSNTAPDYRQGAQRPEFAGNLHVTSITSKNLLTNPEKGLTAYTDYSKLKQYDLTVKYSDGTQKTVPSSDGEFSGVDFSEPDYQLASVEYGNYAMDFGVKVSPVPEDKTAAYVTILGDYQHGKEERHTLKEGGLTEWVERTSYVIDGSTVEDLLKVCFEDKGITADMSKGYISSMTYDGDTVGEFSNGRYCGWQYLVNGESPDRGIQDYILSNGDEVLLYYTDNYVIENWEMSFDSDKVTVTIDDLPDPELLTIDDKAAVLKASEMYNNLSDAEKEYVPEEERNKLALLMEKLDELSIAASRESAHEVYLKTAELLKDYAENSTVTIDAVGGDWVILGLARSGFITDEISKKYYNEVINAVKVNGSAQLHRAKSTENSRVILALTSIGKDVTDVAGYDLLEPLSDMDFVTKQGVNGPVWALIALDSHNYEIPAAQTGKTQTTREKLLEFILNEQHKDGGWGLADESEPDITAMAIQALAPYADKNSEAASAITAAEQYLSELMSKGAVDSEIYAQMIIALAVQNIDAVEYVSPLIENFTDKGFSHFYSEDANQMTTEQAFLALTAFERQASGKPSIYDMTGIEITKAPENSDSDETSDDESAPSGDNTPGDTTKPTEPDDKSDAPDSENSDTNSSTSDSESSDINSDTSDNGGEPGGENPDTGMTVPCTAAIISSAILGGAYMLRKKK